MENLAPMASKTSKISKRKRNNFQSFFYHLLSSNLGLIPQQTPKKVYSTPMDELMTVKK
jgi:hypothetical protein